MAVAVYSPRTEPRSGCPYVNQDQEAAGEGERNVLKFRSFLKNGRNGTVGDVKDLGVISPRKSGSQTINSVEHMSSGPTSGGSGNPILEAKRCQRFLI